MTQPNSNSNQNPQLLKVAWFSYFPVEWLPDLPEELQHLSKQHPATWQRVLWEQFRHRPDLRLHIFSLRKEYPRSIRFNRDNTTFHCIKTTGGLRAPTLYWSDTQVLRKALREINPDIVHAWGTEFGAASVAARLNYPALVTMQGILTWYGSVFPLSTHLKISRFLEARVLRKTRIATTESSFAMKYLAQRYPRLKLLQVEHAPDPSFAQIQREARITPPRLLAVASFQFWKGADVLLKALDGLVSEIDFEFIWVGAGNPPLEQSLREQTSPALWSRFTFMHHLPAKEVARELGRAAIFLHAARADNSPNAVKEAVVAGVPVVATNTGGIPDYVFPGRNGFLFRSGDPQDCREQIRQALAHPLFSKGQVEPATLEQVREYLSPRLMAEKFHQAYQAALELYETPKRSSQPAEGKT